MTQPENSRRIEEIREIFFKKKKMAMEAFPEGASSRRDALRRLKDTIRRRQDAITDALARDLGKNPTESLISEVLPLQLEINHAIRNISQWTKPRKVPTPFILFGSSSKIHYEPRGLVLILSPWNYPLILSLYPLVSAIAAGNKAILKPSEATPHTSKLIGEIIQECFPSGEVTVLEGGVDVAKTLTSLPFDFIFFTGGPEAGKAVYRAASENMVPVALELGGKSPAIIHSSADLELAAERIGIGKFMNLGQTCIAPDYIIVQRNVENEFKNILKNWLTNTFGSEPEHSGEQGELARIVNEHHFDRLQSMLEEAKKKNAEILWGGYSDRPRLFISPTVIWNPEPDLAILQSEIFGPLLPVVICEDMDEAINQINRGPRPLSLYIFSQDRRVQNYILRSTRAGSTAINETLQQFASPELPFGGTGESGIGKGKGYYGFLEFSNRRSVLERKFSLLDLSPPYDALLKRLIKFFLHWL